VAGLADLVVVTVVPAAVEAGKTGTLVVDVFDDCLGVPVPKPGQSVNLFVVAGTGVLLTPSGTTDANGRMTGTMRAGPMPGQTAIRADVLTGAQPSATVYVQVTPPPAPSSYLSQNFFNPQRGERLAIRLAIVNPQKVAIRIYNLAGELIRKVAETDGSPGVMTWDWDGRNQSGEPASNGVYFVQIRSGDDLQIKRVIILRR